MTEHVRTEVRWWRIVAVAALTGTLAACSSGRGETVAPTTTAPPAVLRILVTNDDGVRAPGIAELVQALEDLPATEVTVVAPSENRSGSGSRTTPGTVTGSSATTVNGFSAIAVEGFPADAVNYSLDDTPRPKWPNLVVSGINEGQNLGVVINVSGTVGAARTAAARGIPALAVSQGLGAVPDYPAGVRAVLAWLAENRADLVGRPPSAGPAPVTNLNIPTCPFGTPQPVVEVPPDRKANGFGPVDCKSVTTALRTDVEAFLNGHITRTDDLVKNVPSTP
jgi:5'-nucleotidase